MDGPAAGEIFLFEGFRFERAGGCLLRENGSRVVEPLTLGSRAAALLELLIERQGKLVTKDEIFAAVWPGTVVEEANLTVQISTLRRILDQDRERGSCIQTIPGRGYRFVSPVARQAASGPPCSEIILRDGAEEPVGGNKGAQNGAGSVQSQPEPRPLPSRRRAWLRRVIIAVILGVISLACALVAAFEWLSLSSRGARPPSSPSIIVLPFQNLSGDPDLQRLAYAVTADLTTDFSRMWDMRVISHDIAFADRSKPIDAKQIGRDLSVRYLLDGSLQRSDDHIHINFQLVDGKSGTQLHAQRFDSDNSNISDGQAKIVGRITRSLNLALVQIERRHIEQESPSDLDTRDLVMLGWARLNLGDPSRAEIQRLFEHALEIDPQSIRARLGLAKLLIGQLAYPQTSAFRQIEARIEVLLTESLKMGGNQAQTHATIGYLRRIQNRLTDSRVELEMAIALDRSDSWAYYQLGTTLVYLGQPDAGIPYFEKAIRLNSSHPNIGFYYWGLGASHLLLGHLDQAIELLRKARAAYPQLYFSHEWLAGALGLKGEVDEARAALAEMLKIKPQLTSLKEIRIHYPWSMNPQHMALREKTLDLGLRDAGLPDE